MILKERGTRGWVFVLVIRIPIGWKRYTRREKKAVKVVQPT